MLERASRADKGRPIELLRVQVILDALGCIARSGDGLGSARLKLARLCQWQGPGSARLTRLPTRICYRTLPGTDTDLPGWSQQGMPSGWLLQTQMAGGPWGPASLTTWKRSGVGSNCLSQASPENWQDMNGRGTGSLSERSEGHQGSVIYKYLYGIDRRTRERANKPGAK
jgi:hypothetical protein